MGAQPSLRAAIVIFVAGFWSVALAQNSSILHYSYDYLREKDSNSVIYIRAHPKSDQNQAAKNPAEVAKDFLGKHASALGVTDPAKDLVQIRSTKDGIGMTHMRYQQHYKGVPVFGAETVVHVDAKLNPSSLNGRALETILVDEKPSISEDTAAAKALNIWESEKNGANPEVLRKNLYIFNEGFLGNHQETNSYLVWRVQIYSNQPFQNYYYFIDAHSGDLRFEQSGLKDIYRVIYDCSYGNGTCYPNSYDGNGYRYGRTEGASPSGANPNYGSSDTDNLYDFIGTIQTYYLDKFGRNGANNQGGLGDNKTFSVYQSTGRTYLDYSSDAGKYCPNAYWDGAGTIHFCRGYVRSGIAAHEYTHAVGDFSIVDAYGNTGLLYQGESGAMNESYSDIFGEALEYIIDGLNDWIISPGFISRSLYNPALKSDYFGPMPDRFDSPNFLCAANDQNHDYGGVHHNSGVLSHAAYLVAVGGQFNNCTIQGLGRDKEEKIFYRALTQYLTTTSGFNAAYYALIQACNDLYLDSDCLEVTKALKSVELDQAGACSGQVARDPGCSSVSDECPSDPNKTTPGICGCGVPDTDSDKDGTPDCNDQCPTDGTKTAPGTCGCGVPDIDTNENRIADCQDPNVRIMKPALPKVTPGKRAVTIKMTAKTGVFYRIKLTLQKPVQGRKTFYYLGSSSKATIRNIQSNQNVQLSYYYALGNIFSKQSKIVTVRVK